MNNDGIIEVGEKSGAGKKILILLAICIFVFTALAVVFKMLPEKQKDEPVKKDNESIQRTTQAETGLAARIKEIEEKAKKEEEEKKRQQQEEEAAARAAEQAKAQPDNTTANVTSQVKQSYNQDSGYEGNGEDRPLPKRQRVLTGETLVKLDGEPASQQAADSDDFLQGGTFADGSVSLVKNRKLLLSAGTAMNCVLKTKIITSYPGITMCQLTKDVYSDNGETVLARAGSQLIGEQKKSIAQGVARVFITWTNIKDGNINVRIDALGADGLGASGVPGWVDNHFWERFGGAMLLSFIDDALATASTHLQKSGSSDNSVTFDNTSSTGEKMAEIALENSINIPPTAYINQGEVMTVIVPRNIDFSSVYEVEQ